MSDTEPEIDEHGKLAMTEFQKQVQKVGGIVIAVLCLAGVVSCSLSRPAAQAPVQTQAGN